MSVYLLYLCLMILPLQGLPEQIIESQNLYEQGLKQKDGLNSSRTLFQQSAEGYEKCFGQVQETPIYFREFAAAELLAGNPAHSLWVCRQGLYLFPCDVGLLEISKWLQKELELDEPAWVPFFYRMNSRLMLGIAGVLNFALWLLIFLSAGKRRLVALILSMLLFVFCSASQWVTVVPQGTEQIRAMELTRGLELTGIIGEKPVVLSTGDGNSYPLHLNGILTPGTSITIKENHDDWFLVRSYSGKFGWINSQDILIDSGY